MTAYAHSLPERPPERWEPLFTPFGEGDDQCQGKECQKCQDLELYHGHLNKVAWWSAKFAAEMFAPNSPEANSAWDWGYLAGLWHDLGKFSEDFQAKLLGKRLQVEHTGAGAALAKETVTQAWEILAFIIAGHHAGLANFKNKEGQDGLTPMEDRVNRGIAALAQCRGLVEETKAMAPFQSMMAGGGPNLPYWVFGGADSEKAAFSCYTRMLFSALVDADSIATENFCSSKEKKVQLRACPNYDSIAVLGQLLDRHIAEIEAQADPSEVNRRRAQILEWCREGAKKAPGIFTLNVPTGGGKTLAAMAFALTHILENQSKGMRRVIVAVPYTSIIEQNAEVYARALGAHNLVEHHSNLDDFNDKDESDEAMVRRRLACENWDAPVVVTTNVQFFESLFTHKRSRARKLHNIAGSVVILDEAQCVPVGFLQLIMPVLRDLVDNYGCTVVVSTATQPAWRQVRGKPLFGLPEEKVVPIIPPDAGLARVEGFDRVRVEWPESRDPVPQEVLAQRLADEPCVMAIVHRKKDAQCLARRLQEIRPAEHVFHLSTNMCPVHRRSVLEMIRAAILRFRQDGTPCRVVTTQLVEAGVDLDLPVIYRAMAGLDSITQAAGRCNREGKMNEKGRVVVFYAETEPPDPHLKRCAQITESMLSEYDGQLDIRDPIIFEGYFKRLYHLAETDVKKLMRHLTGLNFETLGREFRLIDDSQQTPIVILYDEEARTRLSTIQNIARSSVGEEVASRLAFRALQPYSVAVWPKGLATLRMALEPLFPGSTAMLLDPRNYPTGYDPLFGLMTDDEPQIPPERLVCS